MQCDKVILSGWGENLISNLDPIKIFQIMKINNVFKFISQKIVEKKFWPQMAEFYIKQKKFKEALMIIRASYEYKGKRDDAIKPAVNRLLNEAVKSDQDLVLEIFRLFSGEFDIFEYQKACLIFENVSVFEYLLDINFSILEENQFEYLLRNIPEDFWRVILKNPPEIFFQHIVVYIIDSEKISQNQKDKFLNKLLDLQGQNSENLDFSEYMIDNFSNDLILRLITENFLLTQKSSILLMKKLLKRDYPSEKISSFEERNPGCIAKIYNSDERIKWIITGKKLLNFC